MVKRKGLGKGLSALIPKEELESIDKNKETIENIAISEIITNTNNPRKNFDAESLNNLADSIKRYGIIQPIVLFKKKDGYEIIAGERRYRAAKIANLEYVPAIVKDLTDKDKDMISMIENIQREDLNPYEEAQAYKSIMQDYSLTQNELSDVIGKSRTYIANIVRLLTLDDETISELEKGNITSSQGRALLTIEDLDMRHKYLHMLINKEITVNEVEKKSKKSSSRSKVKDIYIKDLETKLMEALGAKIKINKTKNSWKVNIEFFDDEHIEEFLKKYRIEDE
ncbi:MAG: ParB/RepB/Spo0J family partition protein [Tissierellia bacterium]|nr:ParB/RepB/Spo0J family partition protein [Tissierellia bacterium]